MSAHSRNQAPTAFRGKLPRRVPQHIRFKRFIMLRDEPQWRPLDLPCQFGIKGSIIFLISFSEDAPVPHAGPRRIQEQKCWDHYKSKANQPSLQDVPDPALQSITAFLIGDRNSPYIASAGQPIPLSLFETSRTVWNRCKQYKCYRKQLETNNALKNKHASLADSTCQLWRLVDTDSPTLAGHLKNELLMFVLTFLLGDGVDPKCFLDCLNLGVANPALYQQYNKHAYFLQLQRIGKASKRHAIYTYPAHPHCGLFEGISRSLQEHQPLHLTCKRRPTRWNWRTPRQPRQAEPDRITRYLQRVLAQKCPPLPRLPEKVSLLIQKMMDGPSLLGLPDEAWDAILSFLAGEGLDRRAYTNIVNLCRACPPLYCRRFLYLNSSYLNISRRIFAKKVFSQDSLDWPKQGFMHGRLLVSLPNEPESDTDGSNCCSDSDGNRTDDAL